MEDSRKVTVSVWSSYKTNNAGFTAVSLKALSDHVWIIFHVYDFDNLLFYTVVSLQNWHVQFNAGKHTGIKAEHI